MFAGLEWLRLCEIGFAFAFTFFKQLVVVVVVVVCGIAVGERR